MVCIMKKQLIRVISAICMLLIGILITGYVTSGPADPKEISEAQLKQDYIEYLSFANHSCSTEDIQIVFISQVDSGCALIMSCKCGSVDPQASWDQLHADDAADLLFYMPDGWFLLFYKDGAFRNLDEAYNGGWLTYEQLRIVWDDFHTQFPKALEVWQSTQGGEAPPERDSSGFDYVVNEDGKTCTITGMGVCRDKQIVIPEYIGDYQVTALGKMAFWAQIDITDVIMPDSVVSIGQSAFKNCQQLKNITLSASLKTIAGHAFSGCLSLETIHLPDSLTSISVGAFADCKALTKIVIPDQVTVLSAGIFRECRNLSSLSLPGGITKIEEAAFGGCFKLSTIEFRGTTAQWNAIEQTNSWWEGMPKCYILCTDGQVVENES